MPANLTKMSAHDFLYSDRHRTLYPDILVYLNGDARNLEPFIEMLEKSMPSAEIADALRLQYRGDVFYATILVHLAVRDGLVERPLKAPPIPTELLEEFVRCENEWLVMRAAAAERAKAK